MVNSDSDESVPGRARSTAGAAFLLAQLGAHAAARFAERVAGLDLTPAQTGLLRLVAREPGRTQQALGGWCFSFSGVAVPGLACRVWEN